MEIEREELQRLTRQAGLVVAKRPAMAVLSSVWLGCSAGALSVKATDLESFLSTEGAAEGELPACLIPLHPLADALKTAPKRSTVRLEIDGASLLLSTRAGTLRIPTTAPPDEFPSAPPEPAKDATVYRGAFAEEELRRICSRAGIAIAADEARYAIGGASFGVWASGDWRIASTDGHRMILLETGKPTDDDPASSFIVPLAALNALRSLCKGSGQITVSVEEKHVTFASEMEKGEGFWPSPAAGWRLAVRPAEESFPDWRRVVPKQSNVSIVIDRAQFAEAIHAALVGDDSHARMVKLIIGERFFVEQRENRIEVPARDYCGPEEGVAVGYNSSYLLDFLASVKETEIRFGAQHEKAKEGGSILTNQGLWTPATETGYRYILMPMRLA